MFCIHCGNKIQDGSAFCINCGEKAPSSTPAPSTHPAQNAASSYDAASDPTLETPPVVKESAPEPEIETGMMLAIFTTCCCFPPTGIVSIVYAAQASGMDSQGQYEKAKELAKKANLWAWITFGIAVILHTGNFFLCIL